MLCCDGNRSWFFGDWNLYAASGFVTLWTPEGVVMVNEGVFKKSGIRALDAQSQYGILKVSAAVIHDFRPNGGYLFAIFRAFFTRDCYI